jgi:hypothetical protein
MRLNSSLINTVCMLLANGGSTLFEHEFFVDHYHVHIVRFLSWLTFVMDSWHLWASVEQVSKESKNPSLYMHSRPTHQCMLCK